MHTPSELIHYYEQAFSGENFSSEPSGLYQSVAHIMNMKGKKIRPLLVLMTAEMFGGDYKQALKQAFAVEVYHNSTLVHDDIMDNADIRRGTPSVHKLFGANTAILTGDAMLVYAYKYLSMAPHDALPALLKVFNQTLVEIVEGQQMDMDFESRQDVTVEEYLKMIEFKTSVLLACAAQIGSIMGGASSADQHAVYRFGLNLGLSFQIKDDLLDAFGEEAKVGKKIGGDILNNKKTYLMIETINRANAGQKLLLDALMQEKSAEVKIEGIKTLMHETGALQQTKDKAEKLYQDAVTALGDVRVSAARKTMLRALAESIHNRDY